MKTVLLATLSGSSFAVSAAFAQVPVFTQITSSTSPTHIGMHISNSGQQVAIWTGGSNAYWNANAIPQLTLIAAIGAPSGIGPSDSVYGISNDGNILGLAYRDPSDPSPSGVYPGLTNACSWTLQDGFNIIGHPAQSGACDVSRVSVRDISGDGLTLANSIWGNCRVAPAIYRASTGWTFWETLPDFPPFMQTGYQSHQIVSISGDGNNAAGWFQSGTGYSGRTGIVWINGQVMRIDPPTNNVLWGSVEAVSGNGKWFIGAGTPTSNDYIYRWSLEHGVEELAEVITCGVNETPACRRSIAVGGVSNNGRIVVGQHAFGLDRAAFIWKQGMTQGIKLDDYCLQHGLDLSQQFVTITSATDISDDGRYITGQWADFGGTVGAFVLDIGIQPCNEADVGSQGGIAGADHQLDNNDFVAFINLFFAGSAQADVGIQGGGFGSDNQWDNNDFVSFINLFFEGC